MFMSKPLICDTDLCEAHTYMDRSDRKPLSWVRKLVPETFQDDSCTVGAFSPSGTEQQVKQPDLYFTRLLYLTLKVCSRVALVGTAPPAAADRQRKWCLLCWKDL